MRTLIVTLAAAFALGGAAVAQTAGSSPAPVPSVAPADVPSPLPSPAAVVHIKNFAYDPPTVTVAAGQTVRFVQDDEAAHTVTATDKSFDSGNLDQHASWSHTFAKLGTYRYVCAYHDSMKATVVVK